MHCIPLYTCQLSCVTRESHACGLKTLIFAPIEDNFSGLTHKSRQTVIWIHDYNNNLIQFSTQIFQKGFEWWLCVLSKFKHAKVHTFFSAQRSSENLREFSVKLRRLRKMIGNPQKTLGRFRKSRAIIARRKSHAFDRDCCYIYLRNCLQWSQHAVLATKQYFKAA